ncbi:hypothetical protein ASE04_21095 [Rhizobium sp. Root708]|uniref:hypothetical protein n=1 Tax=Rhizobium sp. Root708 TaxID=1736592 RepID=UPI0006F3A241|nr:hypothetical protein [Rhizobium sp. Root708]KRB61369.1 hypothetical protein ASE04_21095 [Rhizobium sp. Root708]
MTILIEDETMTREILSASLAAVAAELDGIAKEDRHLGFAAGNFENEIQELDRDEGASDMDRRLADHIRSEKASVVRRKKTLVGLRSQLNRIGSALAMDKVAWEAERSTFETTVRILGGIERQAAVVPPMAAEPIAIEAPMADARSASKVDPRAHSLSTLFSVAGRTVLDARKGTLKPTDKKGSRYQERLETTFAAWLDVIGDEPLSFYLPVHLQDFATVMARVPANRSKFPMFDGLTLREMGEKNDALPAGERKERLAVSTIAGHLQEIRTIWSQVSAGLHGLKDFSSYNVSMPKDAKEAIVRQPLSVSSLNIWILDSVTPGKMKKPHKAWLPLVGLLTGMRMAELVYLQKTDIVKIDGNEVFDLRLPLLIKGEQVDRPTKTKTSQRIVAIHPLLHECGFIDYAKKIRAPDGFIFSRYLNAKDPADAAQKQMSNWMHDLGIHENQSQVFHSLRHNAKHWFRHHLGERIADLQLGHALDSVSKRYGYKDLEPEEVAMVMAIPCPKGVDFSPFTNLRSR